MKKLYIKTLVASTIFSLVTGLVHTPALAVSGEEVAADGLYTGNCRVENTTTDNWRSYNMELRLTVTDGKIVKVEGIGEKGMDPANEVYINVTTDAIKNLLRDKKATLKNIEALDGFSHATCTFNATKKTAIELIKNAKPKKDESNKLIYGKLNLSYADFYYGEINQPVNKITEMQLDTDDKAKSLRKDGMYDSVTSATKNKYKTFFPTTYNQEALNGDGLILGVKDVNVAISKPLYDDVKDAIANGKTCNNPLFKMVKTMRINEDTTPPAEYKMINGDGTLSETIGNCTTINDADINISTESRYGHYQIDIHSDILPKADELDGVVIKTSDGNYYGMEHLENLWVKTGEISFAVKDGFIEPHGNKVDYLRHKNLEGKTITEIKYLVRGKDDILFNTSLKCKTLVGKEFSVKIADAVFENNVNLPITINAPAGSNYKLAQVRKGRTTLEKNVDYKEESNAIVIIDTAKTGVGAYTAVFTDNEMADLRAQFILKSNHQDGDIKIEDNKLVLPENLDIEKYYASIKQVKIDGTPVRGMNVAKAVFGDNGKANFDAEVNFKGQLKKLFTKGDNAEYNIELVSVGYPSVTGKLVKKAETPDEPGNNNPSVPNEPENNNPGANNNQNNQNNNNIKPLSITKNTANITWIRGSKVPTIIASGDAEQLKEVLFDGKTVGRKNYTVVSGSTELTFNADWLAKQSSGKHTVSFVYKDGSKISTTLTIANKTKGVNTSDISDMTLLVFAALISLAVFQVTKTHLSKK
ncbi:MAG: hypothetical protein PUI85_03790 [Eubacteriales bacterium]|nr:hypothetical protein [Eubacteriales bacterium]MDY3332282.1 hypothetical protein [Gallibacter sp.]